MGGTELLSFTRMSKKGSHVFFQKIHCILVKHKQVPEIHSKSRATQKHTKMLSNIRKTVENAKQSFIQDAMVIGRMRIPPSVAV